MTRRLSACPVDYQYTPEALREPSSLEAETLYVVGGLYGNPHALETVLEMKAQEERAGASVTLVFNGDFNWFNVGGETFRSINATVLEHTATLGNVEAELARDAAGADCGCNYPPYVAPEVAARSNRIFGRLQAVALDYPDVRSRLRALPLHRVVQVGGQRIVILHGDPESLAGWSLAEEALAHLDQPHGVTPAGCSTTDGGTPPPRTELARVEDYFRRSGAKAFATTHTCLPFARDFLVEGEPRLLINNGSAGMPNFRWRRWGLLTRISLRPSPPRWRLYGAALGGVHYDAVPVRYPHERWMRRFLDDWPAGSPAHRSYYDRIRNGPAYDLSWAIRGNVRPGAAEAL